MGLQIYEGWIVKQCLPWTGWLVSSSFVSSINPALSAQLFPKPLLGCGEHKRVLAEQQTCSNVFHFDVAYGRYCTCPCLAVHL